jgi:hypothetical protein
MTYITRKSSFSIFSLYRSTSDHYQRKPRSTQRWPMMFWKRQKSERLKNSRILFDAWLTNSALGRRSLPTLPSPHQRSSMRPTTTARLYQAQRMLTLTARGPMCSRVCPLKVLNSATGAGNETMLIAAISLATDATLLADDRY